MACEPITSSSAEQSAAQPSGLVAVLTADGLWLRKQALSGVVDGHDFPVTWVAWEGEQDEQGVPWPSEDVKPLDEHPDALTREQYVERQASPFERFEDLTRRLVNVPKSEIEERRRGS